MKQKKKTKKSPIKLFVGVFAVLAVLVVVQNLLHEKVVFLDVPDNAGVSVLETVDDRLVCVFANGRVAVWDWNMLPALQGGFMAASAQAVVLDTEQLAAVNEEGKKQLTVCSLTDGQKQKDVSVGWDDQEVSLRISPDKKTTALIRRNAPDSKGNILYEFLTLNIEKGLTGLPTTLSIQEATEEFVDTAVDNHGVLYAVGNSENTGRIAALDLEKGKVLWDAVFEESKEFCNCVVSPGSSVLYAGNRDGVLYKISADTGKIVEKIQLLAEGETRPITNDYSVFNLAFSPNKKFYAATINPKAYILKADSDEVFFTFLPADRLVSKIAFSPDSKFVATSDIRAGWPIKIWPLPDE